MQRMTIGITTYNRRNILERMIESLFASNLCVEGFEWTIRVFDDCSEEYSESEIRGMFPVDIDFHRNDKNRGADYNMGQMFRTFLEKGDDLLFNCDSDLIFDENWLVAVSEYMKRTDGILSLFNTKAHKIIEEKGDLCIKEDLGNAGTVMTRAVVKSICDNINEKETFAALDYRWSDLQKREGRKNYSTSRSYVQHIGLEGFNSSNGVMDIGEGFHISSVTNGQILGDVLYDLVTQNRCENVKYRSFFYLFPFDRIPAGKTVVIYGAGAVGQDYRRQIEMCDYCDKLIQVDKNYTKYNDVMSPGILKDIVCDYLIVAAHYGYIREEMRKDILRINPQLEGKLIADVCYTVRV